MASTHKVPLELASAWFCRPLMSQQLYYSLYLMNATPLKRYTSQILSHKIFSFCEQTLKMGANDASGQGIQSALKNKHQNIFSRKLQAFEVNATLFSVKITRQF